MTIKVDAHGLTVQAARPSVIQNITISVASVQSLAFTVGSIGDYGQDGVMIRPQTTQHIRLCATSDCYVVFGPAPIATASGLLLPAMTPEYFWVLPGEKLAVIQVSATGTLNIVECATL